ncbi:hypothetical protein F5Y13DRAFT_188726 [Hypoxylon sp. FL1857]|nr:hypothetical protein F5Y13DRAFT_188726 [Hypoxylon sp. FL1857]
MPSTTRRTTRETTRRTARQTALGTTSIEDRPQHAKLCDSACEQFSLRRRPKDHVRGILFDINSHKPSFIWLNTTNFPFSVAQPLNVKVEDVHPPSDINSNISHRRMHHGVQGYYPHNRSRSKDKKIAQFNRPAATLGRPGLMKIYYCSVLYCGFRLSKSGKSIVREDTTMKDFRAIVDSLQVGATDPTNIIVDLKRFPTPSTGNPEGKFRPWPAVKVNCSGDIQRLSCLSNGNQWPLVEDIFVVPPVSNRDYLHLPWLCGPPWIGEFLADAQLVMEEKHNYGGYIVTNVPRLVNPKTHTQPLDLHCGSLYIVHADGAPIHPNHILAFVSFTELAFTQIRKQVVSSAKSCGHKWYEFLPSPHELWPYFTRERFSEFWERWIAEPRMERMTYKHNIGEAEWYTFGPIFEEAIPWSPYAFAPKVARITT